MDAATVRAMLEQNFEYSGSDPERAHEMYHDDAVLEFPQSGERFVGVENFREWRSNYPASSASSSRRSGAEMTCGSWSSPPATTRARNFGVSIHEFRGEKIARETIYVAEGWEPPEWRAQWRAAP